MQSFLELGMPLVIFRYEKVAHTFYLRSLFTHWNSFLLLLFFVSDHSK